LDEALELPVLQAVARSAVTGTTAINAERVRRI